MAITLTHYAVERAIRVLADENPERTNPGRYTEACSYTTKDGGHCIAGEVIVRLGGRVPSYGHVNNGSPITLLMGMQRGDLDGIVPKFDIGIELGADSVVLLRSCQMKADIGESWGSIADRVLS